jgi:hypothetical protein
MALLENREDQPFNYDANTSWLTKGGPGGGGPGYRQSAARSNGRCSKGGNASRMSSA